MSNHATNETVALDVAEVGTSSGDALPQAAAGRFAPSANGVGAELVWVALCCHPHPARGCAFHYRGHHASSARTSSGWAGANVVASSGRLLAVFAPGTQGIGEMPNTRHLHDPLPTTTLCC